MATSQNIRCVPSCTVMGRFVWSSIQPRRSFSSFSSNENSQLPPPDASNLVQGPSLLMNTHVHRPSPSLFYLPGLRSLPYWTSPSSPNDEINRNRNRVAYGDPIVSAAVKRLEENFDIIREEYLSAVMGSGTRTDLDSSDSLSISPLEPDYDVNIKGGEHASDALHSGTWDWHSYILNGEAQTKFAQRCPQTTAIIDSLRGDDDKNGILFETPFAFCFFSTLQGNSSIKPHVGPMNLRLRIHLPLIVPKETSTMLQQKPRCGMRVGSQLRRWEEGKALVLDDSYQHEVWNNTSEPRVLLLVDIWHPDISREERRRIERMFEYAKEQGWMKK